MKNAFIIGFVNFWILGSTISFGQSQFKNVQIPPVKTSYAFNECEPSIAINPRNTNEIAAGSVLKGYHYSVDGGLTWTEIAKVPLIYELGDHGGLLLAAN